MSVAADEMLRSDLSVLSLFVIFTVNDRSVRSPSFTFIMHSPLLTSTITALFISNVDRMIKVDVTLNPSLLVVCLPCSRTIPFASSNRELPSAAASVAQGDVFVPHEEEGEEEEEDEVTVDGST